MNKSVLTINIHFYIHTHFIHSFKMLCFTVTGWLLFQYKESPSNHWYRGEIRQKKLPWQMKICQLLVMCYKVSAFNYSILSASLFLLTSHFFPPTHSVFNSWNSYFKRTTFIVYTLYSAALHLPLLNSKYQPIKKIFKGPFNSTKRKDFHRTYRAKITELHRSEVSF